MPIRSHANHLRSGRYSQSGQIYLLTAVTRLREPIFSDWRIGRLMVEQFRQAQTEEQANSLAWVVMPDHFHWLVELQNNTLARLDEGDQIPLRESREYPFRSYGADVAERFP